jgi:hypothetical protein
VSASALLLAPPSSEDPAAERNLIESLSEGSLEMGFGGSSILWAMYTATSGFDISFVITFAMYWMMIMIMIM